MMIEKKELTKIIGDYIVSQIRNQELNWKQIFSKSFSRIGDWNSLRSDYTCEDLDQGLTYGFFICMPNQDSKYYYEEISRAIKFLEKYDYCGLVVPKVSNGSYISDQIYSKFVEDGLTQLPISLMEYHYNSNFNNEPYIDIIHGIETKPSISKQRSSTERKSYWCWWRDASHYEINDLLNLSYKYKDEDGDIYSKFVYPEFYEMMVSGQTKQWNGVSRKKERSNASFKAEKQNYKIPLVQLGLWDSKTGKPTIAGIRMREISALYGVESEIFLDSLANMLLIEGKHFDLIKDISDFQKNNREIIPEKSEDFFLLLDDYLMKKGAIGTRKPSAIKTGAKKTYVRDEPKLWNKFGLLLKSGTAKYFVPFEGIKFNWNRISKLITIEIDK